MTVALLAVGAALLALLLFDRLQPVGRDRKVLLPVPPVKSPLGWWDEKQNELVMIHMEDDRTVRGLVAGVSPDGVLLKSPEFLGDGPAIELGGEVFIARARIAWTQIPPPARRALPADA